MSVSNDFLGEHYWLVQGTGVTADGEGVVSHAGLALLRQLADRTALTAGLSRALASPRLLIHDRGRVTADLACAIADGSEVISDFRVLADQKELFGTVASMPTTWRTLNEIAAGGPRALGRIATAANVARRQAWAGIEARHGAIPLHRRRAPGACPGRRPDPHREGLRHRPFPLARLP
jgi:hypothetical protein